MTVLSQLNGALAKVGFSFKYAGEVESIWFTGAVATRSKGEIWLDLVFEDDAFLEFPKAFICNKSRAGFSPYHFPHLDGNWQLCYEDASKVFDCLNPDAMANFIVGSIVTVLDTGIADNLKDMLPEFFVYWKPTIGDVFSGDFDLIDEELTMSGKWILGPTQTTFGAMPTGLKVKSFHLPAVPGFAGVNWPISDMVALKKWLRNESTVYCKIVAYLERSIRANIRYCHVLLCFDQDSLFAGLSFSFDDPLLIMKDSSQFQPSTIKRMAILPSKIFRFWVERYTVDRYITASNPRNHPTLLNRRVALVGAGTIGSNLANVLVRSGAGSGPTGRLTIIDPDLYQPYNFSRHWLGIGSSGELKAIELAKDLKRLAPFATIDGLDEKVQNVGLGEFDLVIDSTGEEALTTYLSRVLEDEMVDSFFVSVWVRSDGTAVESFSRLGKETACHECLRRSQAYSPVTVAELPLHDSCRSVFVPFPVTASISAALLATHTINLWLTGQFGPSLYCSQSISPVSEIYEATIDRNEGCVVCGKLSVMV